MAAFIDDLALEYFLVTLVSVLTLYTIAYVYLEYRKNGTKNLRVAMAPAENWLSAFFWAFGLPDIWVNIFPAG